MVEPNEYPKSLNQETKSLKLLESLLLLKAEYDVESQKKLHTKQAEEIHIYLSDSSAVLRDKAEQVLFTLIGNNRDIIPFLDDHFFQIDKQLLDDDENPIIFTCLRARIHSKIQLTTVAHAYFYEQFNDEYLGLVIVKFLLEKPDESAELIDSLVPRMIVNSPFNVRRGLAKVPSVCNRYLHLFLQPGLPLYSIDAMKHVEWNDYKNKVSPEQRRNTLEYINRIAKLNPAMNWVERIS